MKGGLRPGEIQGLKIRDILAQRGTEAASQGLGRGSQPRLHLGGVENRKTGAQYVHVNTHLDNAGAEARLAAPDSVAFESFHDGDATKLNVYLDYIFCSALVTPQTYRTVTAGVDGRYASDHFPIYADVTIAYVTGQFQRTIS